ncbi:MAG TPA: hypothetical protein VGX48_08090 [Pyrinomonadaceae bacterium]|jgi:hypothetical protein|nr:hypothetical protein [Pyrinomonadaceae bacterium]
MTLQSLPAPRFIRRTRLGPNEYRKNFHQIDRDIMAAVTSHEADLVTPLMSKIYLRLVNAPDGFWEREGVLRIEAEERGKALVKAWVVLCDLVGVASATASKALRWMHEQGIIGYFAGKNGVGIRIFLNRAVSSIGVRQAQAGKKILAFAPGSPGRAPASANEAAFMDSFAVSEVLETDLNPRAPKNGADTEPVVKTSSAQPRSQSLAARASRDPEGREQALPPPPAYPLPVGEIVERLKSELEPCVRDVATRAAAQSAAREMERTREWFEAKALPKAVRVAQRETYELLRKHGGVAGRCGQGSAGLEVGRGAGDHTAVAARPLTAEEVRETAEVCVALLETQGKSIEVTLSEISSMGGGWLLPEDAPRVREAARELSLSWGKGG